MVSHFLLDYGGGDSVVYDQEERIVLLGFDIVQRAFYVVHLYFQVVFGLLAEEILDSDHDLCWASPSLHDLALHADPIKAKQCILFSGELPYNLRVMPIGLASPERLSQDHLADPYHAPPADIPELVL